MKKRIIDLKVLPGEPKDGSGRTCIHLFVSDAHGTITEPHVLHSVKPTDDGEIPRRRLEAKPTRGKLACEIKRNSLITNKGNVVSLTLRTDDPRATTCPKCKESKAYQELMERIHKEETQPCQ